MKLAYRVAQGWAGLAILPLAFLASALWLRHVAGPDWIWRYMDPDYFYLFDGLNIASLHAPHHIYHPGTPVQVLLGLIFRTMHPFASGAEIAALVAADPHFYLDVAATVLLALDALAMGFAGWATWRATQSWPSVVLVQLGPLLSMLTLSYGIHVRPEALAISAVMMLAGVVMLAVRGPQNFAILFGIVVALGAATKVTALPLLGATPLFLLGSWRGFITYAVAAAIALAVFLLPIAGDVQLLATWIGSTATSSGAFGTEASGGFQPAGYLHQIARMLARPILNVPLVLGLALLGWTTLRRRAWTRESRAVAGLVLGMALQAAVVAKQPSGHYMIPAFCAAGLLLALELDMVLSEHWRTRTAAAVALLLVVAQGAAVVGFTKELRRFQAAATPPAIDSDGKACAQVFFYPASNPDYALLMGNYQAGDRFTAAVRPHVAATSYYVRDWLPWEKPEVRQLDAPVPLKELLAAHPCTVFRGGDRGRLAALLARDGIGDLKFDAVCPGAMESAYVLGGRCASK